MNEVLKYGRRSKVGDERRMGSKVPIMRVTVFDRLSVSRSHGWLYQVNPIRGSIDSSDLFPPTTWTSSSVFCG